MGNEAELWKVVEAHRQDLVAFAQKLVQTPSPSGQEGDVAELVRAEMERLAYDDVEVDAVGNVRGHIAGGDGPALMLNGHMDHVAPGNAADWRYPPFGGEIHAGELWGRGSVDMKGALAAMVYAGGLLKKLGLHLPADLYVAAVVQEEVGGLGSRHLAGTLPVSRAVVGEASANDLRRGHRGRVEVVVHLEGRAVHASMPDLGVNPHYSLARFVSGLRTLSLATDPTYGASTVAPTCVLSEPESTNVTPDRLHLTLDWRNIPGEGAEEIVAQVEALLERSLEPGCRGRVQLATRKLTSYTGVEMSYPDIFPSFTTAADEPWLLRAQSALEGALHRQVGIDTWPFATDGGHFAAAGVTVIGLGPGDDRLVHTVEERLPLAQLVESTVAYMALALLE